MRLHNLRQYESSFKSADAYEAFVTALVEALRRDSAQLISDGDHPIGAMMAPSVAKEVLYQRLHRAFAADPDLLDKLKEGFQDDDLEEL